MFGWRSPGCWRRFTHEPRLDGLVEEAPAVWLRLSSSGSFDCVWREAPDFAQDDGLVFGGRNFVG